MKKIVYGLFAVLSLLFVACEDDLPQASWDLYEVNDLTITPLDASAELSWTPSDEAQPTGYYISWTSGSLEATGGNLTINDASQCSALIENLVNKVAYTFYVQAVYNGKRSGRVSASVTPVSSLIPPTAFTAVAGDSRVRLSWTKPASDMVKGYQVNIEPDGRTINIENADAETYIVPDLVNGQEYTISLQAVYDKGISEAVTATVTPGEVSPFVGLTTYVLAGEELTMGYNDMYFMGEVQAVAWTFGDGTQADGAEVFKAYENGGEYTLEVEVTYADGSKETAEQTVYVIDVAWETSMGYIKASNPVFSPDGSTFYLPTADKVGDLNAFDAATGEKKWTFAISDAITYGGGSAVGPDGVIYQGARNSTLYAVMPDGSAKWQYATGADNTRLDCFPAVSADGTTVYALDGDNMLHAVDTSNGTARWTKALEGTANKAAAIAIDRDGTVYVGTRSYVYAFTADGEELWKTSAAVTEIGSFAIDGGTMYAAQAGGAGLIAINTADGQMKWTVGANGDAYAPIVSKDGTVYFVDKGGKSLYAVSADGSLKWKFNAGAALTYCFPVLDDKGIIYFGASNGVIHAVDSYTGVEAWQMDTDASGDNAKIMAGLTIGMDGKLYVGYIGGNLIAIPVFALPETSTWSCRGGNIQGTCQY